MRNRKVRILLVVTVPFLFSCLYPQTSVTKVVPDNHSLVPLQKRAAELAGAMALLDRLIQEPAPQGLKRADRRKHKKHTIWLNTVLHRLSQYHVKLNGFIIENHSEPDQSGIERQTVQRPDSQRLHLKMKLLNVEFSKLLADVLIEARTFGSVSNFLKARHDSAMATIRNMK